MIAKMTGEAKTHADALPYGTRTLFDVLDENKVSWRYYWDSPWPPFDARNQYARTMFSMHEEKYDAPAIPTGAFGCSTTAPRARICTRGDQVLLFSERYQPDKVSTGATGYDPYMRLAPETTGAPKYLKFRAGEWDVWKIEN